MKKLVIPDECFDAVMDEVSRAIGKAMENPFVKRDEREAFYIITNSLRSLAEERFGYLPVSSFSSLTFPLSIRDMLLSIPLIKEQRLLLRVFLA